MTNTLNKVVVFKGKDIDKFSRAGDNRFSMGFTLISFFSIVVREARDIFSYTISHKVYNSSSTSIASFRDFKFGFIFTVYRTV